jgi:Mn-dependent DtxR family transcriptional regulator
VVVRSRLAGYGKRGRIWVNPNVPKQFRARLIRHETVERQLRKQGMTYKEAHRKALEAEHKGLTRKQIARYEGKLGAIARWKPYKR